MSEQDYPVGIESRLSRLEGLFERAVTEWKEERRDLRQDIHELAKMMEHRTREKPIPWGAVLGALSMLGAFILLYVNPVREWTKENQHTIEQHQALAGHPDALMMHARTDERLNGNEIIDQRQQDTIEDLNTELGELRELSYMLTQDRFTGTQAAEMERRILMLMKQGDDNNGQ